MIPKKLFFDKNQEIDDSFVKTILLTPEKEALRIAAGIEGKEDQPNNV